MILKKIHEKSKDIINNIKNKNNYNNVYYPNNKKYIPYKSDRCFDDFDWDSLYAN